MAPEIHEQFLRRIIRDPAARVDRISGVSWGVRASRHVFAARNDWGTERMAAGDIFARLLEQRRIQVTDPDPSDPEGDRRVVNATETTAAQEKASLMQERFGEWVWEDPARAAGLVHEYNRRFNSIVLRDYTVEGERLTFPGLVEELHPAPPPARGGGADALGALSVGALP
ncbi:hypothetical protein [Kocuria nitroreducens]|uniref:hypothetical protein n=1 Tax=Kocuria nitroreducens TaxID=3058914 RepID=UPI0036DCEB54